MTQLFARISLAIAVACGVALPVTLAASPAAAQDIKILVVDLDQVMVKAKAAESIRAQYKREVTNAQGKFKPQLEKLAEQEKELGKQRTILSPEVFNERVIGLRKQKETFGKELREREVKIGQAMEQALLTFRKSAVQVVSEISGEQEADLVLPNKGVVLVSPDLDITDEVIKRLDRKTPDVKVNFTR